MTSYKQYLTWDQTDNQIQWDNNPYTWDEVFILIEITQDGRGGVADRYKNLPKEKKKKLIKLIATVRGEDFKEEKYKQEDIKTIVKDISIVAKEILGIEIKINN